MIGQRVGAREAGRQGELLLGTPGRLAILGSSMLVVLVAPAERFTLAAGLALAVNALLYPQAIRRLFQWRWLIFAVLLVVPSLLWAGEESRQAGLLNGLEMLARAMVVLLAVDGFTSAVDIAEVAGLFERVGLTGLGFSMGVAVNLLPALRHSSLCAWRSLRMRGGFRRRRRRALQLLLVTIVANALRRAEEIALAAEVRAFAPERSRALPIRRGRGDWLVGVVLLVVLGALVVPLPAL